MAESWQLPLSCELFHNIFLHKFQNSLELFYKNIQRNIPIYQFS